MSLASNTMPVTDFSELGDSFCPWSTKFILGDQQGALAFPLLGQVEGRGMETFALGVFIQID